jgi:hypothetical protein
MGGLRFDKTIIKQYGPLSRRNADPDQVAWCGENTVSCIKKTAIRAIMPSLPGLRRTSLRLQLQLPARRLARRRNWWCAPPNSATQRWRSPMSARFAGSRACPSSQPSEVRRSGCWSAASSGSPDGPKLVHVCAVIATATATLRGAGHARPPPRRQGQTIASRAMTLPAGMAVACQIVSHPLGARVGHKSRRWRYTELGRRRALAFAEHFPGRCWIVLERHLQPQMTSCRWWLVAMCTCMCARRRAAGRADRAAPQYHGRSRRHALFANGERHLRKRLRLCAPLPAGVAGRNRAYRRALRFFARRTALRIPRGSRARRPDADGLSARGWWKKGCSVRYPTACRTRCGSRSRRNWR